RQAACTVGNYRAFLQDNNFQPGIQPSRTRSRTKSRRDSSDDYQSHQRLFLLLHLLNEVQNIEGTDLAVGIETVNGVLLIVEGFEGGGEAGHDQQLDIAFAEIHQLDGSPRTSGVGGADHQRAQARAIDEVDVFQVEDDVDRSLRRQFRTFLPQGGRFLA